MPNIHTVATHYILRDLVCECVCITHTHTQTLYDCSVQCVVQWYPRTIDLITPKCDCIHDLEYKESAFMMCFSESWYNFSVIFLNRTSDHKTKIYFSSMTTLQS